MAFNFQRLNKATLPSGDSAAISQFVDIYRRAIDAINPDLTNLQTGDWAALVGDLNGFENFLRQIFNPLKAALIAGAVKQDAPLSRTLNATIRFDITDPRAIAYAEDRVGELIKQVGDEIKQTVRDIVARAYREGRTVDQIAAELRNSIGLHDRWAKAVDNFQRRQFEQFVKTMPYDTALEKAAALAEKYRARLIRKRAMTIARTETGQASMYGRYLSWLQASDSGLIDPYTTGKRWFATRPCDRCKKLNGETVGMLEPFSNGKLMPLDHPNCKCRMVLIPNWKTSTNPVPVQKAYKRKYATQREAAQAAANARWGNRTPDIPEVKEKRTKKVDPVKEAYRAFQAEAKKKKNLEKTLELEKVWLNAVRDNAPPKGEWRECGSIKEAKAQFYGQGWLTEVHFGKLSIPMVNEVCKTWNELGTKYPEVAYRVEVLGGHSGLRDAGELPVKKFSALGYAFYGPRTIALNDSYSRDQYEEIAADSERSGWHPQGTGSKGDGVRSVLVHEFGHMVGQQTGWKQTGLAIEAVRSNRPAGVREKSVKEFTKVNLSEYATKNSDEAFAEAFTEYHMSPNPRPLATEIVERSFDAIGKTKWKRDTVTKAYKRKYATREEAARAAANARWGNRSSKPSAVKEINWTKLETIDEVNAAWSDKHGSLVPGDFTGMGVRFARQAAGGLDTMFDQYPDVAAGLSFVGSETSPLYRASVQKKFGLDEAQTQKLQNLQPGANGGTSMKYGYVIFSDKPDNDIADEFSMSQFTGWIVPTRLNVKAGEYIAVHEFGHAVARHMGKQGSSPEEWSWARDIESVLARGTDVAVERTRALVTDDLPDGGKRTGSEQFKRAISEYAGASPDEAFAESWAEIHLSDNPRPYAIGFVNGFSEGLGVPVPTSKIAKAYKRKFATREEAARFAANARWGGKKNDAVGSDSTSTQFEPWKSQPGIPEIEAEWKRRFPHMQIGFRDTAPNKANELAATFTELAAQYPEVAARIKYVGDQRGMNDINPRGWRPLYALGDSWQTGEWLRFNSDYSADAMDNVKRDAVATAWSPEGTWDLTRTLNGRRISGTRSIMVHEFGHQVDYWLREKALAAAATGAKNHDKLVQSTRIKIKNELNKSNPLVSPVSRVTVPRDVKQAMKEALSQYSNKNGRETFAEAFVEYHLSDAPRSAARQIISNTFTNVGLPVPVMPAVDAITKAYQRKYGSRSEAGRAAANARWGGRTAKTGTAETAAVQIEPWVDQGSIKDINKAFNERWGERTILDLTGADINAANGIADGLNELLTLYPDTELHFVGTEDVFKNAFSGRGVSLPPSLSKERKKELIDLGQQFGIPAMGAGVAGSYITTVQGIRINADLIAPNEALRFALSSVQSEDNNFYAKTGLMGKGKISTVVKETAKRTLVHEFGHAIDFTGSHPFGMVPVSKRTESSADPVGRAMAGMAMTPESRKKFVANYIGEYASTNSPELFAEVFTEYHLNPKPRKLSVDQAQHVMKQANKTLAQPSMSNGIEKAYQRKYGSRTEAARAAANARWGNRAKTEDTGSDSGSVDRYVPSEKLLDAIDKSAAIDDPPVPFEEFAKTPEGKKIIAEYAEKVFANEDFPEQVGKYAASILYRNARRQAEERVFYGELEEWPGHIASNQQKLKEILATQPVTINLTSDDLEKVFQDGRFKSQFETGDSEGAYNPEKRNETEAIVFGYSTRTTSPEKRPIYGSIPEFGAAALARPGETGTWLYGDTRVVLKDSVRSRTTFTAGDSLGMGWNPSSVENPRLNGASLTTKKPYVGYIEAQIHGGVNVSDIKELVVKDPRKAYPNSPDPKDSVAAKIGKQFGIPVRVLDLDGTVTTLGESA